MSRIDGNQPSQQPKVFHPYQRARQEMPEEVKAALEGKGQGARESKEQKARDEEKARRIRDSLQSLNEMSLIFDKGLRFQVHEATERTMVKVIEKETDRVLKEIPPEEVLNLVARIRDLIGLMLDVRR